MTVAELTTVAPPYGDLWKVARVDVMGEGVTSDQREELYAWLQSLGVPYRECRPNVVITQNSEDARYLLHLARFAVDANGDKYVAHAENVVHTTPLVVAIKDFPAWLVQASHIQDQPKEA
ncbi:hypothetical protein Rhe02_54920 [Rhizocola hellebori]|uniref:Uncharacterized protein n=1 Tax=Rhizocola hellebori TaxID=1392758 RepID=A0A8J3QBB5_9ACTN|nr:hypothetical protein [Rhizocola hellebori]GIH07425.1 hypothetical protein Rhe02_54920 [Rhizocola hellebori]